MKNLKVLLSVVLILAMAMTMFVGCGGGSNESEESVYELSWAGVGSAEEIDTWIANEVAARVAEATNNQVVITVYPSSQLGDMTQAYDEIIAGTIDMGMFTIYGTYDILQEAKYTPFLCSNFEQVKALFGRDGWMFEKMAEVEATHNVELLGMWSNGFLGLAFAKLDTTQDLFTFGQPKKELLRVPGMDTMMKSAEAMGYTPTIISYSDVYTSLQTGVIDGSWHSGVSSNYNAFRDVIKYFVDYRCCLDVYSVVMSGASMAALPEEYQEILRSTVADVVAEGQDQIEVEEAEKTQALIDYGVEVVVPTDEQRAEMTKYFSDNVWPTFAEYYGEGFMAELVDAVAAIQ